MLQEIFGTEGRPDHVEHLAAWLTEVFGGEPRYTLEFGGHVGMVRHHVGRGIEERHRVRFVEVTMEALDEAGLPDDERFRTRFREYLEWGSQIALEYQDPAMPLPHGEPVPQWAGRDATLEGVRFASLGDSFSSFFDAVGSFFSNLAAVQLAGAVPRRCVAFIAYLTLRARASFNILRAAYPGRALRVPAHLGRLLRRLRLQRGRPGARRRRRPAVPDQDARSRTRATRRWRRASSVEFVFDLYDGGPDARVRVHARARSRSRRTSRSCRRSTSRSSPRTRASRCSC